MTIYSRFGLEVEFERPATEDDIRKLENREPDEHDRERFSYGMYVVGHFCGPQADWEQRIFDAAMLRADDGIREINDAIRKVGGNPK